MGEMRQEEARNVLEDAQSVRRLGATFDAAYEFGLDEKEIWAIIFEVCSRTSHGDAPAVPMEELSAALALKILEHERSAYG